MKVETAAFYPTAGAGRSVPGMAEGHAEDAGAGGRRGKRGQGGNQAGTKFTGGNAPLGSAKDYLGDEGAERTGKRREKLQIVKKGEGNKNLRDKASVAYNHADFLSQAHNLTDQCKHLVEALS